VRWPTNRLFKLLLYPFSAKRSGHIPHVIECLNCLELPLTSRVDLLDLLHMVRSRGRHIPIILIFTMAFLKHADVRALQTMVEVGVVIWPHTLVSGEGVPSGGLDLDAFVDSCVKVLCFYLLFVFLLLLKSLSITFICSFIFHILFSFLREFKMQRVVV